MDRLVTDDIPNIRFNVAKSYAVLIEVLKKLPENGTLATTEKEGIPHNGSAKGTELIPRQDSTQPREITARR